MFVLHCCVNSIQNIGIELTLLKHYNFQSHIISRLSLISLSSFPADWFFFSLVFVCVQFCGLHSKSFHLQIVAILIGSHETIGFEIASNTTRNIWRHQSSEKSGNSFLFIRFTVHCCNCNRMLSDIDQKITDSCDALKWNKVNVVAKEHWAIEYKSEIVFLCAIALPPFIFTELLEFDPNACRRCFVGTSACVLIFLLLFFFCVVICRDNL